MYALAIKATIIVDASVPASLTQPLTDDDRYTQDERRWAAWMASAQGGDTAIYARLLGEIGTTIEAYIRARFGAIDVLEDCVQECLMTLHQARHTYDPTRLFRPWLFTLVRHKTIDVLRRRQVWLDAQHTSTRYDEPVGAADRLHQLIDGIRVLERLALEQREAVALVKYGGYTTAEAAVRAGITESALKARLVRGLQAIRRLLDDEESAA